MLIGLLIFLSILGTWWIGVELLFPLLPAWAAYLSPLGIILFYVAFACILGSAYTTH